jgi:hypothetical protein
MSLLTNLISYWPLDETGNAIDAHGSNDLTETGGTIDSVAGVITNARDFEATDTEYFTIADNTDLSTGDIDFTISCWVKLESNVAMDFVSKFISTGDQREFRLGYAINTANRFQWILSSAGTSATTVTTTANGFGTPTLGVWYHIVAWHDTTNNEHGISVNSGTPNTTSDSNGVFDSTSPFQLGWIGVGTTTYFDGCMCEVGFWKRVLTSTERGQLYNSGSGLPYSMFGYEPNAEFVYTVELDDFEYDVIAY